MSLQDTGQGETTQLIRTAITHLDAGRIGQALECANRALVAVRARPGAQKLPEVLMLIGSIRLGHSEYPEAMGCFIEALALRRAAGGRDGVIECLYSIGQLDMEIGNYSAAASAFSEALELLQDDHSETAARLFHRLGMLHSRLGDIDQAREFQESALRCYRDLGDEAGMGSTLNSIGTLFMQIGESTRESDPEGSERALLRARSYFEEGLQIASMTADRHLQGLIVGNIGGVVARLGHAEEALSLMHSQLQIVCEVGDRYNESLSLANIGEALRLLDRRKEAIEMLERSLAIGVEVGSSTRQRRAHEELAHCFEELEDFASAYRHLKRFQEIDETIRSEQTEKRTRELQVKVAVSDVRKEAEQYRAERDRLSQDNQRLHDEAYQDALTGVANRRHLDNELDSIFERVRVEHKPLSVALADIDLFKQINDRFSHAVGDQVLREVGRLLRVACRDEDLVARYGGEEFALVLVGLELKAAVRVCERVRSTIEEFGWESVAPGLKVTVSLGLTDELTFGSSQSMLATADRKLYQAKREGRNRVCA